MIKILNKFNSSNKISCLQKSINLLSKREYSQMQLQQKLQLHGYSEDEIKQTLKILQEKNLQSDERFIEHLARKNAYKSQNLLNNQLKQHNVSPECRGRAQQLQQQHGDEFERATLAWNKKFANKLKINLNTNTDNIDSIDNKEKLKLYNKQLRFLLSQGFSYDTASKVIKLNFKYISTLLLNLPKL